MLEGILEKVLLNYFGDLFDNLDKNKLSVALWSGSILLENLSLNKSLLDKHVVPIRLVYGKIRRINVVIDWKSNFTKPTIIEVDGVDLVLGVLKQNEWKEMKEIYYPAKIAKLKAICKEKLDLLSETSSSKDSTGYVAALVIKIIDNIQLTLKNVHVRVEERNEERPYSMGMTLKELSVVSTNAEWKQMFIERTSNQSFFYKLLTLNLFGVYLNFNETQFTSTEFNPQVMKLSYLIQPMALSAKIIQNATPKEGEEPAYKAEVSLDRLGIDMKKEQYDCIGSILNNVSSYRRFQAKVFNSRKFLYFKPKVRAMVEKEGKVSALEKKVNTLEWWRYLIGVIQKQLRFIKGNSKAFDIDKEALNKFKAKFLEEFKKVIVTGVDSDDDEFKRIVEVVYIEVLITWLSPLIEVLYKEKALKEKEKKKGYFSSWFSSSDNQTGLLSEEELTALSLVSQELLSTTTIAKPAFIFEYTIRLEEGWIALISSQKSSDALKLKYTQMTFNQKAHSNRFIFKAKLHSIDISYYQQSQQAYSPITNKDLSLASKYQPNAEPILAVAYTSYSDPSAEYGSELYLKLQSQDVIYSSAFIKQLNDFLALEIGNTEGLQEEALQNLALLVDSSQQKIKANLSSKSKHKIDVQILERCLYVPIKKDDINNSAFFVFNFGYLKLTTPIEKTTDEKYELKYSFAFDSLAMKYYSSYSSIANQKEGDDIFSNVSGCIQIEQALEASSSSQVSQDLKPIKAVIDLNAINLRMTDYHYSLLLSLGQIFALSPPQKSIAPIEEAKHHKEIGMLYVQLQGINSSWLPYWSTIAQNRLLFYINADSKKSIDSFDLKGSAYSSIDDSQPKLILRNKFKAINVQFTSKQAKDLFVAEMTLINFMDNLEESYQMVLKRKELSSRTEFEAAFHLPLISCTFTNSSHQSTQQYQLQIENNSVAFALSERLFKLSLSIEHIKLINKNSSHPSFSYVINTQADLNRDTTRFVLIDFSIDNATDEIAVDSKLGYLNLIYQPRTVNDIIRLISTKPFYAAETAQDESDSSFEKEGGPSCLNLTQEITVKAEMKAIRAIFIQPNMNVFFFEVKFERASVAMVMKSDHLGMQGSVGSLELYDLTHYPFTIKTQEEYRENYCSIVLGSKKDAESLVDLDVQSFQPQCPLLKNKVNGILKLNINSVFLNYAQEQFIRVLNYILNEIVPSISVNEVDANLKQLQAKSIDSAYGNLMEMKIVLSNPQLILKARPQSTDYFLVDFGTVSVTNGGNYIKGRILSSPNEERLVQVVQLEFKGAKIQTARGIPLSDSMQGMVNISSLIMKREDFQLSKEQIDSSTQIDFYLAKISLSLHQNNFTQLMRCVDLNLAYTDYQAQLFGFNEFSSNEEKLFYSKKELALRVKQAQRRQELRVKGFIEQANVKLMIEDKAFAEMSLSNLHLSMQSFDNKEVEMRIILSDIELIANSLNKASLFTSSSQLINHSLVSEKDIKAIVTNSKDLISSKQILPSDDVTYPYNQLAFSYKMNANQEKLIQVQLDDFTLFVKADSFALINGFFVEGFPSYLNEPKENFPNSYDPNEENTPKLTVELTTSKVSLGLTSDSFDNRAQDVIFLSSEFFLLFERQKVAEGKTRLRMGKQEMTEVAKANLKAKNVNIALYALDEFLKQSPQDTRKVKERKISNQPTVDFSYVLNLEMMKDNSFSEVMKFSITFEEIELKLSYRDIVTALRVVDYQQSLLASEYENYREHFNKQKPLHTEEGHQELTFQPQNKGKTQQGRLDLNVTGSKSIRIILINNDTDTYYPFLSIIFNTFVFMNKATSTSSFNSIASFNLQAYSFNYLASYWEPLIESFPFYVSILFDGSKANEAKYSVNLNADNNVISSINISDLSIEFTYRNLNAWIANFLLLKNDYKAQKAKVIQAKFPQSISNHKVFNYSGRRMTLKSKQEVYVIEPNQSNDLDFYPEEESSSKAAFAKKMKHQQVFSFELEKAACSSNFIDIDGINCKVHSINSGAVGRFAFLVSKVELNGLKKHVYFLSPLVFKNKTQSDIQLVFSAKGKSDISGLLKPLEWYGVQSEYIEGEMRLVFSGKEEWRLRTAELLTEPGVLKEKRVNEKYFLISYTKSDESSQGYRLIDIRHGFLVKNCLPLNVILTIPESKKSFPIGKGVSQVIDCVSYYSVPLKATLEVEKVAKRTEVILYDPKQPVKSSLLKLTSNEGSPIEISSTLYNEEERLIILHSEQVLVNMGGDDIQFFIASKNGKYTPIPYQSHSVNMFILNPSTTHLLVFQYKGLFSEVNNLKELPSFLEIKCTASNSNCGIHSASKPSSSSKAATYEFVLETKMSLIDIGCNLYSTVLTLCPKYYIFNQTRTNLSLEFIDSKEKMVLNAYQRQRLDCKGKVVIRPMAITEKGNEAKWKSCLPFDLFSSNLQTVQFSSAVGREKLYVNVEKCKETISTVIYLAEANESNAQFVLCNKTSQVNCQVYQLKHKEDAVELKANSSSCFSLSDHSGERFVCLEQPQWGFTRYISFKEKSYVCSSKESDKGEHPYSVPQLPALKEMTGLLKIQVESTGFQIIITLSEELMQKTETEKKSLTYEVTFKMNHLGLNIIGDNRHISFHNNIRKYIRADLLYLQLKRIDFYFKYDEDTQEKLIQFCLQDLLIGNEISSSPYYPILFSPLNEEGLFESSDKQSGGLPIVNIIASYKVNLNNKVNISELSISVQAFKLKAESTLMVGLFNFIQNITIGTQSSVTSLHPIYASAEENLKRRIFIQGPYVIQQEGKDAVRETDLIIDFLSIPSFKVKLSFINQSNDFLQTILKTNGFLSSIFGTMTSIEDVPLNLNGCEIHRFIGNWSDLLESIAQHYKEHILAQAYKIFGGISILGSPNTFLSICSNGVNDLYKEPANGFKNGPLQGFVGIAKGGASLVQHTVEGTLNSTSQVTSGLSKAILLVSQDDEYMKSREQTKAADKPKNLIEGVGFGIKSFATGLFHGVTDIVVQPIKGAQEDNLKGFGKGLLKGFGGIISKPVSGLFDLVSKTTEGIKNNVSSNPNEVQLRYPRVFYGRYKLIKIYDSHHSEVIALLRKDSDLYDKENLGLNKVCPLTLKKNKKECMLLLTSEGIALFNVKKLRIAKRLFAQPMLFYDEISSIDLIGTDCIRVTLKSQRKISIEFIPDMTNTSTLVNSLLKAVHNSQISYSSLA